jgi:hypothetical protein
VHGLVAGEGLKEAAREVCCFAFRNERKQYGYPLMYLKEGRRGKMAGQRPMKARV